MTAQLVEIPGYIAGTWTIDPVHSYVGFSVRHMAVSRVRGRFGAFEGEITTADDPLRSSVRASIDLASVDTGQAQRDEHLRSADFFDVAEYPVMTYRSTGLRVEGDGFVLDGDLSLRDVTQPVPLTLELGGFGPDAFLPDPSSGARVGFTATGQISRLAFGVGDESPIPGAGGLFLSDKVQIVLEIEGVLKTGG